MLIKNFHPSPELKEYIRYYQVVHLVFSGNEVIPFKAFAPRPENCLCFFPADRESLEYAGSGKKNILHRAELIGQHLCVTNRHIGNEFLVIRVIFQPGVLFRMTGIPSDELTNTHLDAECLFGSEIRQVNERLSGTRSYAELFRIIETFFLMQVRKLKREIHAADRAGMFILTHKDFLSMDALADHVCLSPRQLMRKFTERIGVGPSVFTRITRFDRSLEMKNSNATKNWADVAMDCGYHDYQHLVRDYKEFTTLTPTEFLKDDHRSPENALGPG